MLAGWIAVGLAASVGRGQPEGLTCTFLSVGHGCAIVLELPSGETVLYDAGQFGSPEFGARSVAERERLDSDGHPAALEGLSEDVEGLAVGEHRRGLRPERPPDSALRGLRFPRGAAHRGG